MHRLMSVTINILRRGLVLLPDCSIYALSSLCLRRVLFPLSILMPFWCKSRMVMMWRGLRACISIITSTWCEMTNDIPDSMLNTTLSSMRGQQSTYPYNMHHATTLNANTILGIVHHLPNDGYVYILLEYLMLYTHVSGNSALAGPLRNLAGWVTQYPGGNLYYLCEEYAENVSSMSPGSFAFRTFTYPQCMYQSIYNTCDRALVLDAFVFFYKYKPIGV